MTDLDPIDAIVKQARVAGQTSEALQQLSHDVRSAMSDVLGGIRLIDTPRLDPQTQTQFDRVRAAADTLAALVDDVLLIASGDTLIEKPQARVVVAEWLEALQSRWSGRAAERGCAFTLDVTGDLPAQIDVAPIVMDRITGNLIDNALRHSGGEAVRVEVMCTQDGAMALTVSDTGRGFPEEVLNGDTPRPQQADGHGLGLGIVRALSAEIGATVTFSNGEPPVGAQAMVRLPVAVSNWTVPETEPRVEPDLTGLRILVAEDNLTNQTILRQMLEAMGAKARYVTDGVAALQALHTDRFDLALIDIEMPRMSGLEVMEQVRSDPSDLARMPLVAITAYVMRDNREAIYAAGADGIIGKPVASGLDLGRAILRHVGQPIDLPDVQAVADGSGLEQKMNLDRLNDLLAAAGHHGSAELLDRVAEDLTAVQGALDASVAACDLSEIRSQTHILIAISGAMGAERLCQLSEVLNIAAKRGNLDQLPIIYAPMRRDHADLLTLITARRSMIEG